VDEDQTVLALEPGFRQKVHHMLFSGGDIREDFLLQEVQVGKVNALEDLGEKQCYKFGEKSLKQFLKQPVVVDYVRQSIRLRFFALPMDQEKSAGSSIIIS
jgi:hypothetical protein